MNSTNTAPLVIEQRSIAELIPYAANSRTHSEQQIDQIAASIKEFSWTNPILISSDNVVRAGHARLEAAKKLQMTEVPVIVLGHLSQAQLKALVIADNRIVESGGWNQELLKEELGSLHNEDYDLEVLGFDDEELEDLLSRESEASASTQSASAFEEEMHMRRITVTPEQYGIVEQVVEKFRISEKDTNLSIGRVLELICGDWLSGH